MQSDFDYGSLDGSVRSKVENAAKSINAKLKRTVADIVEIGKHLVAVKELLDHGQFMKWVEAEFGWGERTPRRFMSVAQALGKSAKLADLPIAPSAAYLLCETSVSASALDEAVSRAESGERITHAEAKEIVARHKPEPTEPAPLELYEAGERLREVIYRVGDRWPENAIRAFPAQLRIIADHIEKEIDANGC